MRSLTLSEQLAECEGHRAQMEQRFRAEKIADLTEELADIDADLDVLQTTLAELNKRREVAAQKLTALGVRNVSL